ncbi:MAG: sulfatase-like hydrolase/transferase [Planctomycetota bacterium]
MCPRLLGSVVALLACLATATTRAQEAVRQPRNVLLLFADDLRRDALGVRPEGPSVTPNLDGLAARGTRLTRVACMGSRHGAVCMPSRAMLMSGRGLTHVTDDLKDAETLPERLRAHGLRTFMTGKWHNGRPALTRAFPDAGSVFLGGMCDHFHVPLHDVVAGKIVKPRTGGAHSSELFADAAIAFLEAQAGGEAPFFAYVAFTAPHDPRDPPPRWLGALHQRELPPLPANFRGQHGLDLGRATMTVRDENLLGWPRDPDLLRQQLAEYRALVAHLDEQVGRILDALARSGRADETLVVFAADHGLALGSHGLLGKQSLYEHSMGAPVIVAGPGVSRSASRSGLAYLFDLPTTICAAVGAAAPAGSDGIDLGPLLRGEGPSREVLFTLYAGEQRALRDDRYKLLRLPSIDRTLLFDLQDDPDELHDLSGDADHAEVLAAMAARLRAEQERWGDALPWTAAELRAPTIDLTGHPRKPDQWQPAWIVDKYFR